MLSEREMNYVLQGYALAAMVCLHKRTGMAKKDCGRAVRDFQFLMSPAARAQAEKAKALIACVVGEPDNEKDEFATLLGSIVEQKTSFQAREEVLSCTK